MELFTNTENTNWIEIHTVGDVKQPENFWDTINLLMKNPHFINRQLMGSTNLYLFKFINTIENTFKIELNKIINSLYNEEPSGNLLSNLNTIESLEIYDFITKGKTSSSTIKTENTTTEVAPPEAAATTPIENAHHEEGIFFNYFSKSTSTNAENNSYCLINKLHPKNVIKWKNNPKYNYEFYIVNEWEKSFNMISYQYDQYQFGKIQLINSSSSSSTASSSSASSLSIYGQKGNTQMFMDWLKYVLSPRFAKWLDNTNKIKSKTDPNNDFLMNKSLALINIEYYTELYNHLKEKYSGHLIETWPENTDAIKFVYEDVAIATYLILLWKREDSDNKLLSTTSQKFVDLGCGNGLLVHLLASEGYTGYGIDIRKRRIWDTYPKTTVLKEQTIIPSNAFLFPDINWIIGNHSDELSPWIPVIAARSSYTCKYFLLPCCAYNFNGTKFQRRDSKQSQYMDFLQYTKEISTICGFETAVDRLKIPSTKRICLIGTKRRYPIEEFQHFDKSINDYINLANLTVRKHGNGCNNTLAGNTADDQPMWNTDFKPRETIERVRNCTQINKDIEKDIVDIVFKELLSKKRILDDNEFYKPKWNIGGCLAFSEIIDKIPNDKLKALKSECGGLQTLLKNNHQIFRVACGQIQLRIPQKLTEKLLQQTLAKGIFKSNRNHKNKNRIITFKEKPCWYLENHPDGCPFLDIDCSFKHFL